MYYLDTNICVYFLNGKFPHVLEKIKNTNPVQIKIPSIVKAELLYGAEKSHNRDRNFELVNKFLEPFEIKDFDDLSSIHYSKIRSTLEQKGSTIGPNDYIIASTVLSNDGILVTNNIDEFKRIKGLRTENWSK